MQRRAGRAQNRKTDRKAAQLLSAERISKVGYDTKIGSPFHFYFEDIDELSDIPDHQLLEIEITPPNGTRVAAIDVVRLKKA